VVRPASRAALEAASVALAERDPVMAELYRVHGPCRLRSANPDGPYAALVRAIVFQQLHGRAAATIHDRFRALVPGPLTPEAVLALSEEQLRGAGLSRNKALSIQDLSRRVLEGSVHFDGIARVDDEDLIAMLTTVRGIGRWTAEMLLIFELRRLDVWPVDDLGVRSGYARAYGLVEAPKPKALLDLGEAFRPYRSVAAWYCYRAVDVRTPEA
jgi:DNA-3-methyladenine glycosylase II